MYIANLPLDIIIHLCRPVFVCTITHAAEGVHDVGLSHFHYSLKVLLYTFYLYTSRYPVMIWSQGCVDHNCACVLRCQVFAMLLVHYISRAYNYIVLCWCSSFMNCCRSQLLSPKRVSEIPESFIVEQFVYHILFLSK